MSYSHLISTALDDPHPGATDHMELRAAEIAKREGHSSVTDEDRESALHEMEETSLQVSPDADASH